MTTLINTEISTLLDRLFEEDAASTPALNQLMAELSPEERTNIMQTTTEYQHYYSQLKDMPLAVSRETGRLLYMLARSSKVKTIVEFGTSFGISTIHLAAALRDNGGGHLITSEFESSKIVKARANLTSAGLMDLVEIREGDALQTLKENLPDKVDLLLLDGAKALYPHILKQVENHLSPGALIIADNANYCPEYLELVRNPINGYLSIPFGEDVELSIRIA